MGQKATAILFCGLLVTGMAANLLTPDREISYTERRKLAQRPQINQEFLLSEDGGEKIESYLLDQFWGRDSFRSLKVTFDRHILRKSDSGGLYQVGDHLFKMEYPLREDSVRKAADKMQIIAEKYLGESRNVAFAVIPDKSHYLPKNDHHLTLNYQTMTGLLQEKLPQMDYLPLDQILSLQDYYYTDLHWKQENLKPVTEAIWRLFGKESVLPLEEMEQHTYQPFYGAYYGQMGALGPADTITWLTDPVIDGLKVTDYDEMKKGKDQVYSQEKLGSVDSYELFFAGNSPLIVIDNPAVTSGDRLILFRDSFASALAPLLAQEYSQVILVDLRFMGYEILDQFVDFSNSDVLFLWGQSVYNNSDMIRQR